MSEKLKPCPVCGANKWTILSGGGYTDYCCKSCGTTISKKFIAKCVLQWVDASERLPEKEGHYWTMKDGYRSENYFCRGLWVDRSGAIVEPERWLDDRTEWK